MTALSSFTRRLGNVAAAAKPHHPEVPRYCTVEPWWVRWEREVGTPVPAGLKQKRGKDKSHG